MDKFATIDDYVRSFPPDIQSILGKVRQAIKKAAPQAAEAISYGMPAFRQKKVLVYFAAHKNHIGFYPTGSGIEAFKKDLSNYKFSKGAIQFPLDKPVPYELIDKITRFRVKEVTESGT
jgi:uncharacterized protein YdhG (YjbR/CyaY superfamily)